MNSIPATCFEIGSALTLLQSPGEAGEAVDSQVKALADVLDKVYNTDLGNKKVIHNKKEKTLKEVFNEKLLREIKPTSDQLGRCFDKSLDKNWFEKEGLKWLTNELNLSVKDENYSFKNMLTKIRMIGAFGVILKELFDVEENKEGNKEVLGELLNMETSEVAKRFNNMIKNIQHEDFNLVSTRNRFERPPILDENTSVGELNVPLEDGLKYNLGFGKIYTEKSFTNHPNLKNKYIEAEKKKGRQGLPRENQPIKDLNRPGNISETGLEKMPNSFKKIGLPKSLKDRSYNHGTGVNRWQINGSYSKYSWANGLPSAGAHSGSTALGLLALDYLSRDGIFGKKKDLVYKVGLFIASFMNFGAYHTFSETLPIISAYNKGEKFQVQVKQSAEKLYGIFLKLVGRYFNKVVYNKITNLFIAYKNSFKEAKTIKYRNPPHHKTENGAWVIG